MWSNKISGIFFTAEVWKFYQYGRNIVFLNIFEIYTNQPRLQLTLKAQWTKLWDRVSFYEMEETIKYHFLFCIFFLACFQLPQALVSKVRLSVDVNLLDDPTYNDVTKSFRAFLFLLWLSHVRDQFSLALRAYNDLYSHVFSVTNYILLCSQILILTLC